MSTIHITNGDVAAGPLQGIDDTPQVRADFWQRASGDDARDFLGEFEAQATSLKAVVDGATHVVVWHGQSAADQLTLRRVCFHLREMPQRLNEVCLSIDDLTGDAGAPLRRPDQATSVGMFAPDLLLKHLPHAAPISVLRIGRLALEWQEVKLADAELRRWRGNTFMSGSFAELDARIFEHAAEGWQSAGRVAAHVMAANNGLLVSDSLVLWRLRELAATGQLQLRGESDMWRSLEMNVTRATLSPA